MTIPREISSLHAIDALGPPLVGLQLFQLLEIIDFQGFEIYEAVGIELPPRATSTILRLKRSGPQSKSELAGFLGMSHQLVSYRVKDLASAGLVEERRDPNDGRRSLIALSRAGRALATKVERVCNQMERVYADLFKETGVDLFEGLIRIKSSLAKESLSDRLSRLA